MFLIFGFVNFLCVVENVMMVLVKVFVSRWLLM